MRGGVDASFGDLIVIGDADGQHDFSVLSEFVAKFREAYDAVIVEYHGESRGTVYGWH